MANGKRIEIATLERAQHEDLTRSAAFSTAATLEIMRGLFDDLRWPMTYPGGVSRSVAVETPLRAHVLSGLLVRPDNNSYLTVDPGALLAALPPASGDDSVLELVNDPGVSTGSTLAFVANGAGSVRLDIVEVSVVDATLETATRGVWNASTRDFDPTSLPKVKAPQLSYRIRQGTAGAGLPANASGWLPLAVVCHQSGTTSFADCDLWDVRPLIADRVQFGEPHLNPTSSGMGHFEQQQASGHWRCSVAIGLAGYAVSQFNGYLAGGQLISNTAFPLADRGNVVETFAPLYVPNQDPAFSMSVNTIAHVVACFPGGLPRWVKYVDVGSSGLSGQRVPTGPRGILVITNDQPLSNGYYAGVTLPTVSGFTADAPGVALASLAINSAGTFLTGACVGRHVTFGSSLIPLSGIAGVGTSAVTWTFSPRSGVIVPAHARSIDLTFNVTTATSGQFSVSSQRDAADADFASLDYAAFIADAGPHNFTVRGIPLTTALPWNADGGGLSAQTHIELDGPGSITACAARISGYSF